MALYKAIEHGKEKRKPWRDTRAFDPSCRNHKGCGWCESNRMRQAKILEQMAKDEEDQWRSSQ